MDVRLENIDNLDLFMNFVNRMDIEFRFKINVIIMYHLFYL